MKQELIGTNEIGGEKWSFASHQLCGLEKLVSLSLTFLVYKVRELK